MAIHPKLRELARRNQEGEAGVYGSLWKAGQGISGGFGFWGSSSLYSLSNPKPYVKAFIDGGLDAGLSPMDAVLYGDWTDGRHIADELHSRTPAELRRSVADAVRYRGADNIHRENKSYLERDDIRHVFYVAGLLSMDEAYAKKEGSGESAPAHNDESVESELRRE